ncbi:MAG: alpha/beta hydrolase [Anaerolineales bacterium]|jgi:pimeloyl-ACP methyl ester carboxylesterase|nr:alpha/beta hydrolase [Anaerolineales bacterium]
MKRAFLYLMIALLLVLLIGPFLVPVPELEGTVSARSLADPDSQFIEINGLEVHVKTAGEGERVFVLMHGFGASLYSWQAVMQPLSQLGRVIAYDRPAFGLTERPLNWEGVNPYGPEAQVNLVIGLLDHFGVQQAILVGNSAGGTIAMQAALAYPERVQALILVDPAVYNGGGAPGWIRPLLKTPQMRHLGPLIARQIRSRGPELLELAWHDPSRLSPEMIALYEKPLKVQDWDRALWELTLASQASDLEKRLAEFTLPVLVVTGDDDRIVPTADSVKLANQLPGALLEVIIRAGHVPHEEQPEAFMEAVRFFLQTF